MLCCTRQVSTEGSRSFLPLFWAQPLWEGFEQRLAQL